MLDIEKVLGWLEGLAKDDWRLFHSNSEVSEIAKAAFALLKEQEAEIRQLRLALDIAKGMCKGIKSGGGQFADMPTMQYAT